MDRWSGQDGVQVGAAATCGVKAQIGPCTTPCPPAWPAAASTPCTPTAPFDSRRYLGFSGGVERYSSFYGPSPLPALASINCTGREPGPMACTLDQPIANFWDKSLCTAHLGISCQGRWAGGQRCYRQAGRQPLVGVRRAPADAISLHIVCDAGAPCEICDVRLANGTNPRNGRLEALMGGRWGRVSGGGLAWDAAALLRMARAACAHLGFGGGALRGIDFYGEGALPFAAASLDCAPGTADLDDCSFERSQPDSGMAFGVACSGERLCRAMQRSTRWGILWLCLCLGSRAHGP